MAAAGVICDMGTTLTYLLRAGLGSGPDVQVATPATFEKIVTLSRPAVSVFLYRIGVHAEMRNASWRTLPQGKTARPLLPLELFYLITPWANRPEDEHQLAGQIIQTLYDHSELGPADLQGESWSPDDSVQLILESLSTDELSRIWETAKVPCRLSLPYLARVVGIEPTEAVMQPAVVEAYLGRTP